MEITAEIYELRKTEAEKLYKSFRSIRSNALNNREIHFQSEGFNHLIFKNARTPRSFNDQVIRFSLLPLAYKVLKKSTTYQEYEEILQQVEIRKYKIRQKESVIVRYWGFIAIISNRKIKVIVRQIDDKPLQFWSVIPFWRTTSHGDMKFKEFASGNLIED